MCVEFWRLMAQSQFLSDWLPGEGQALQHIWRARQLSSQAQPETKGKQHQVSQTIAVCQGTLTAPACRTHHPSRSLWWTQRFDPTGFLHQLNRAHELIVRAWNWWVATEVSGMLMIVNLPLRNSSHQVPLEQVIDRVLGCCPCWWRFQSGLL